MPGTDTLIERMTLHDYSSIATSSTSGLTILAEIDVSAWREGTLEVLLKAGSAIPASASIKIIVGAIARSSDDPGQIFANGTAVAEIDIDNSYDQNADAKLILDAFGANFGGSIAVYVTATRGNTGGSLKATFETHVSLKS